MDRRRQLSRSASTESTEYSLSMGRSMKVKKKPKERWLLTRKTWRYMADAGRKLIPDGAQNRPEDIPKIEAYFQEVCRREPRFLLWRKNSYPGALGFRKKKKERRKGGSCRKAVSADDVDLFKPERPKDLALTNKFDIHKMKEEFLNKPPSPANYLPSLVTREHQDQEETKLLNMLEKYLSYSNSPSTSTKYTPDFNYQELVDKLQCHLTLASRNYPNYAPSNYPSSQQVFFSGDHVQKSLSETLSRYFSHCTNRDKVISDLLTDRKALEKLYFELRKTKGFRGGRGGTSYVPNYKKPFSGYQDTSRIRNYGDPGRPPPLIEIECETITYHDWGIQTAPITEAMLQDIEKEYRKNQAEKEEEERLEAKSVTRRKSSVENDDVSQSVSDTIKRYLRMARKKSVNSDKIDRFKSVNYDRNLRNIKAKGETTKPGDDDGLNKGCQTNDDWILTYRDLKFDEILDVSDNESRFSSSRSSIDQGVDEVAKTSPNPVSPSKSHSFLSNLLHKHHDKSAVTTGAAMQKSKSSSSVMHHGSRLMAKKIFRSRSKSQTRPTPATCSWTPQGGCVWTNLTGKQVILSDTNLVQLTEVERKVLQKVALAKLQALNLGVAVKIPTESVGAAVSKPKRRPYLLKRKAITTSIFDTNRKEGDKEAAATSGLVFGIPLNQCVENDRLNRITNPAFRRSELAEEAIPMGRHGSRSSFSSLIDTPPSRGGGGGDESGSCESLMTRDRIAGSVPGQLDALSCGSTPDLVVQEDEAAVPNILNECFRHLEQNGLHTLGIFRVSTSKKRIRQLREDFDCGKETALGSDQCPHDVATLLKEYLRDLPDPLLCRDLYNAFIHTQRIRNRRLQFEALQHLVQLLPSANRDTLYALLSFLAVVARHSSDTKNALGEEVAGNKMDSNNLATVFAPNILHCIKPGSKDSSQDRPEDRIDIINVVRMLIDHYKQIFTVSADLLDEIYVHMMDFHPEALDQLLNKRDVVAADESVDELDSESYSATWSPPGTEAEEPKKMYSREEFLHEAAATGGPNVGMRIRHKDRIKERSIRRKREESASRKRREEESGMSSTKSLISRLRGQRDDDYQYGKNRSSSIESTSSTYDSDIRVRMTDDDERRKSSPYVLDNSGIITASLTIPVHQNPLNLDDDIPFIEDEGEHSRQVTVGMVKTVPTRRRQRSMSGSDSAVGSSTAYSSPVQNTSPPPSWTSSPPTSPDSTQTSIIYIPDEHKSKPVKVTFTATQQVQQTKPIKKSTSTPTFEHIKGDKFTPSITSIGNAVLRSRTADFERITKDKAKEKKKYTKRRYTDSRHQTGHIPDSTTLESSRKSDVTVPANQTPVYKRRELISSVPSK